MADGDLTDYSVIIREFRDDGQPLLTRGETHIEWDRRVLRNRLARGVHVGDYFTDYYTDASIIFMMSGERRSWWTDRVEGLPHIGSAQRTEGSPFAAPEPTESGEPGMSEPPSWEGEVAPEGAQDPFPSAADLVEDLFDTLPTSPTDSEMQPFYDLIA